MSIAFCEKKKDTFAEKRWNYISDVLRKDEREIRLMSSKGKKFRTETENVFDIKNYTFREYNMFYML